MYFINGLGLPLGLGWLLTHLLLAYDTETLTNQTTSGFDANDPAGFAPVEADYGQDVQTMPLLSAIILQQGDAVRLSGGYIVSASSSTAVGDIIGISMQTTTGTSTNNQVDVDTGIQRGKEYNVICSDAAVAATQVGAPCNIGASQRRVLLSAAAISSAQFVVTKIVKTGASAGKAIVTIRISRGRNT